MNRIYLFLLVFIAACANQLLQEPIRIMGEAQGTYYSVIYYDDQQRDFQYEIDSILKDFDLSLSLWVPNSIISMLNRNDSMVLPDKYFIENFEIAREVANKTNGAFDPTVGSLVRAWGFGFDATKHVDDKIIDSILQFTGYQKIRIMDRKLIKDDIRTTVDFNAIAQGYSVDLLGSFLEEQGIMNYLVDIGGEVKARGSKPDGTEWKVGIEKPTENKNDQRDLTAVITLNDKSIATSGNYRKFYEEEGTKYSHSINPKTGYPVQHSLLSVSVMAESTAIADAYATAFMVMGLEDAKSYIANDSSLEAFFIYADEQGNYQTYASEGFISYIKEEY